MHWPTWRDDSPRTLGQVHFTSCWRCPKTTKDFRGEIWIFSTLFSSLYSHMNEIYFYSVQIWFFQWEKFSPVIPESSLEIKQHRREILSLPPWFDFTPTLTKGSWCLIGDGHQYFPAQRIQLRMGRKTDYSPSEQRLKVHYRFSKSR